MKIELKKVELTLSETDFEVLKEIIGGGMEDHMYDDDLTIEKAEQDTLIRVLEHLEEMGVSLKVKPKWIKF